MLERTYAIMNEVLEPITFVLASPTIHTHTHIDRYLSPKSMRYSLNKTHVKIKYMSQGTVISFLFMKFVND